VHRERSQELRYEIPPTTSPAIPTRNYLDTFGNIVRRFIAPCGDLTITSDAIIEDSGLPDPIELDANEVPVEQLPDETWCFCSAAAIRVIAESSRKSTLSRIEER